MSATTPPHSFPDGLPPDRQPRWRRDFPIEVPEDDRVTRRDFTLFLILTSGAFAVGQLWIGLKSLLRRGRRPPARLRVAALDEVPAGGALVFHYPGEADSCLLVRTGEREFVAYGQKCTHLACAVQPDVETGRLRCPCHNGWFDLQSGRPLAGPPRRPLPRVVLEISDGAVYATGVELRT